MGRSFFIRTMTHGTGTTTREKSAGQGPPRGLDACPVDGPFPRRGSCADMVRDGAVGRPPRLPALWFAAQPMSAGKSATSTRGRNSARAAARWARKRWLARNSAGEPSAPGTSTIRRAAPCATSSRVMSSRDRLSTATKAPLSRAFRTCSTAFIMRQSITPSVNMSVARRIPMASSPYWSMLKRGYQGTYHKMSPKHLQRYVTEFAGRHNVRDLDTLMQMTLVARGMDGRRLPWETLTA